ncbi:hypothetical protein BAUCODRAFT_74018, partial [Baudoinia panamericana UAMH 10762]
GCWSDQTPARTLTNMTYQGGSNTIDSCAATCASGNNTIAGLANGDQCFCGSTLGYMATQVIDSSCASPCTGNGSEICGGALRLSFFANGRPIIAAAPSTPEVVNKDFYFVNCYTEATTGRTLGAASTSGLSLTLEYCASSCSAYQYFGVEYGDECYCGNSLAGGSVVAPASDCNMLSAGNRAEFCGAGYRLTVYQNTSWVAPTGTPPASAGTPMLAGPSCPGSNATTILSGGKSFMVECGISTQ